MSRQQHNPTQTEDTTPGNPLLAKRHRDTPRIAIRFQPEELKQLRLKSVTDGVPLQKLGEVFFRGWLSGEYVVSMVSIQQTQEEAGI